MLHPCIAPLGGAFHPKVILLRFRSEDNDTRILRLLVLSRNLTFDNAWDLALQLDGVPSPKSEAENNDPIRRLFHLARSASSKEIAKARASLFHDLLADLDNCHWDLPAGFDSVAFHLIGDTDDHWEPGTCDRLAVISPFLADTALARMAQNTQQFSWLVSRPEELGALSESDRMHAEELLVLSESATEPDETADTDTLAGAGLHAKCLVQERGTRTHLFAGSANATHPIFGLHSRIRNTEFMVELSGPRRDVGGITAIFGDGGLRDICQLYEHVAAETDAEQAHIEHCLETAHRAATSIDWRLRCEGSVDQWHLTLSTGEPLSNELADIIIDVWPLTTESSRGARVPGELPIKVRLGPFQTIELTSLLGFELSYRGQYRRFGLEIPVTNMPSASRRDQATMRHVVRNRSAFLRYLAMLLGEMGGDVSSKALAARLGSASTPVGGSASSEAVFPLFEQLARAYARDPASLRAVARVMRQLEDTSDQDGDPVVPDGFRDLWTVFEQTLALESNDAKG
ncbi:hypothetical protein SADO_06417 [Salinisphaera dokdonensis CL-ES53]|uniref:Phospholipase D-like domain-containing protein n=2 Tax=Salinisphaera TaxID=180541 RepID=A0ABV2AZ06_9GAMM